MGPRRSGFDGVVAAAGQADMGSKVVHVDRGDDEDPATVAEVDCGQAAEAGSSVSFKDDDGMSVVIEYDGAKLSLKSEKSLRRLADPLSVEHVTALRYGYNHCTKTHFLSADGTGASIAEPPPGPEREALLLHLLRMARAAGDVRLRGFARVGCAQRALRAQRAGATALIIVSPDQEADENEKEEQAVEDGETVGMDPGSGDGGDDVGIPVVVVSKQTGELLAEGARVTVREQGVPPRSPRPVNLSTRVSCACWAGAKNACCPARLACRVPLG